MKILGAQILLKLLDWGVYIFTFVIFGTIGGVIYVEIYHGSSTWIVITVSAGIFFTMAILGVILPAFGDTAFWDTTYRHLYRQQSLAPLTPKPKHTQSIFSTLSL